jgi:glycosyltransferase involved in cell wall biosynthesis
MKIAIDGRILHRNISGTERYIWEIYTHLEKNRKGIKGEKYLVAPPNYTNVPLKNIISNVTSAHNIELFHRTYQASIFKEVAEMLIPKKCVYTYHDLISCKFPDYFPDKRAHEEYVSNLEKSFWCADRIIAISHHGKKDLMQTFKIPEEKIDVVYHGIDTVKFRKYPQNKVIEVRQKYNISKRYIFNLGTDYPHKNLKNLFIAFKNVLMTEEGKDLCLVLAGNKYYCHGQQYLQEYLAPIESSVVWLGYVDDDDIPVLYNGAEMFVYPSLYEGFGFPVLESFACETPLVCSSATSIPEIAGNAALIVDATAPDKIAKGILSILRDEELRKNLIEKGKNRVKEFTWERCAKNTMDVYLKTLESATSAKYDSMHVHKIFSGLIYNHHDIPYHYENGVAQTSLFKAFLVSLAYDGFAATVKKIIYYLKTLF